MLLSPSIIPSCNHRSVIHGAIVLSGIKTSPPYTAVIELYIEEGLELTCVFGLSYSVRDNLVLDNADEIIEELKLYKQAGGRTVCDVTSIGIRIKPDELARISRSGGSTLTPCCMQHLVQRLRPTAFGAGRVGCKLLQGPPFMLMASYRMMSSR